ncbi:hypothetical protein FB451DRAFT_1558217 [Mycena latifolia]|nr:hypothetical protein FB451DRAFT_1558217 [Mycena latifolia]
MVKLGFSASVVSLFAFFSFVSAASLPQAAVYRRAGVDLNNITGVSNTTSRGVCASECAQPQAILDFTCANVTDLSLVPCGCSDSYAIAQEACFRCRLSHAGSKSQMEMNQFNEQKNFEASRRFPACLCEGGPAYARHDNIQLFINRPMNFTFETPLDMYDESFPDYITVVCQRPDLITPSQCIVGGSNWTRCPNSDVSGILVRFSAYMANLLLGIVLMYSPAESSTAVWTQLLTVYSLLISAIIAIGNGDMSRFHSGMTTFLVMSPLSSTLVVYAILGFCGRSHRLDSILSKRREHLLPRLLVIAFGIISLALIIFTSAANADHFTANPCEADTYYKTAEGILLNLLFIPYTGVILVIMLIANLGGAESFAGIAVLAITPFIIVLVSFVYGLVEQRHLLAQQYKVQNDRWKIWVMWDVLAVQYPLLHFYSVFFVPMVYWILVNEIRTIGTPDNMFSSSFGQILALFVILPPLLQSLPHSLEDGIPEKDSSVVDPFKDPAPESYQVHNLPGLSYGTTGESQRF